MPPSVGNQRGTAEGLGLGGSGFIDLKRAHGYEQAVRDSAVRAPSEMLAIGDAYWGGGSLSTHKFDVFESFGQIIREGVGVSDHLDGFGFTIGATGRKRHVGQLNMVFCDGHVEGLKVQRLFFSKDERDMRLWNSDNEPHRDRLRDSLR